MTKSNCKEVGQDLHRLMLSPIDGVVTDIWETKPNWKKVRRELQEAYNTIHIIDTVPFNDILTLKNEIKKVIYKMDTKDKRSKYFKVEDNSIFMDMSAIQDMAININTEAIIRCTMKNVGYESWGGEWHKV